VRTDLVLQAVRRRDERAGPVPTYFDIIIFPDLDVDPELDLKLIRRGVRFLRLLCHTDHPTISCVPPTPTLANAPTDPPTILPLEKSRPRQQQSRREGEEKRGEE
jgi:hypothetical protein